MSENTTNEGNKSQDTAIIRKFFKRKYDLFSKFDEGIQLNDQQWYSVTPESIARYTALQIQHRFPNTTTVFDPFGGAGGNTIQLGLFFDRVIYNELDKKTYEDGINNAGVYGLEVESYNEDFYDITPEQLQMDPETSVLFASPPWGGPSYLDQQFWDLDTEQGEKLSVFKIVKHALKFTKNLCLFLPKTSNLKQIAKLVPKNTKANVDYVHSNGRCIGMVVFIGPGIKNNTFTR